LYINHLELEKKLWCSPLNKNNFDTIQLLFLYHKEQKIGYITIIRHFRSWFELLNPVSG